ncbi:MAG TPA: ribosome biogenesis GTPase Der [Rhodospirillales bacterium]|jgi:GTP-binding protein|nr:ribosome biogenesis GTPase Der [Rhodospirillales bacterium]
MTFTVAIVGRPNVGKSTLFNRLAGKRLAIVNDKPGVTRDRREGEARLGDLDFTVIDTAGLDEASADSLEARMLAQTERALADADVALILIDARAGLTPLDEHFAHWLRCKPTPVILVANKCEGGGGKAGLWEAHALGLGDPIAVSAEHGEGMGKLHQALAPLAGKEIPPPEKTSEEEQQPLQLAIVGRPNVGKSTLVNRLLGEERLLTGPEAGITRDAIPVLWTFQGRDFRLVDTAGLRRKSKIGQKLEGLSASDALRAIRFAQVVVLVIDGEVGMDKQDLTIARLVADEGRGLILAINKWDLVKDRKAASRRLRDRLETSLAQARGVPLLTLSALTGGGVEKLLPKVLAVFDLWNRRVATGELNRWLAEIGRRHPPPMSKGRRVRLRYITQAKSRPPTFILFASHPEGLPDSYLRYMTNELRQAFGLPGVPIRLHPRKGRNPYVGG